MPGRLTVHGADEKAAWIYAHLQELKLAANSPASGDILAAACRALNSHLANKKVRWLPLSFQLCTETSHLGLYGTDPSTPAMPGAIVVHAGEQTLIEPQNALLKLEADHPGVGKYVWAVLVRGLDVIGNFFSPAYLLPAASRCYWEGEDNEKGVLGRLQEEGENIQNVEMIRRRDIMRGFPKWILEPWDRRLKRPPRALEKWPGSKAALAVARSCLERDLVGQLGRDFLQMESIPVAVLLWDHPLMGQIADDYLHDAYQEYQTQQAIIIFDLYDVQSFDRAWGIFQQYLDHLQQVEDLLDALLGPRVVTSVRLEPGESRSCTLKATHAILVYAPEQRERGLVTIHDIARGVGHQYVILPGKPASQSALYSLLETLNPEIGFNGLLPERLLRFSATEMVWYKPGHVSPIFFKTGQEEMDRLNGKSVIHPSLLFRVRGRQMHVVALPDQQRPREETPLYRAPYYNLDAEGRLCTGTAEIPELIRPDAMAQWENTFFLSAFTHSNCRHAAITRHPQGHADLWQELAGQPRTAFPQDWLVPLDVTLKEYLDSQ